jgi:hypothetical protein
MLHMGKDSALNVHPHRTNTRKRLAGGLALRSDMWSRPFPSVTNGAGRMDAPEHPYPPSAIPFFLTVARSL